MNGVMSYCELAPAPDLAHVVLSYAQFAIAPDARGPIVHEVITDGCISLVYHRNPAQAVTWLKIVGPRLEALRTEVHAGDCFWIVRLSPAACRRVLGCAPASLLNQLLLCSQLLPELTDELLLRLDACRNFAQAIAAYATCLSSLGIKPADIDLEVAASVRLIEASQGQARIAEVAGMVGLSVRQLERRFRAVTGLTPKQFARVRRLRATALALIEGAEINWAARAAEMGFADQSHLTREFVALTGRSPVSFAEDLARIEHGELVK
jgi:AraC-like DNA-binding protein